MTKAIEAISRAVLHRWPRLVGVAIALCIGGGCSVGPTYRSPTTVVPAAFPFDATPGARRIDKAWWTLFADTELDRHIDAVLAANQDLALAIARFDESRAMLGIAHGDQLPTLGFNPGVARGRTSGDVSNRLPVLDTTLIRAPLDVAYELDFWGRVRHSVAAARALVEGNADTVANLRLSLAAQAANAYLLLRSSDRDIAVLDETVAVRRDALQLAERRARAGVVGDIDAVRARADLAVTRADLADAQRRREVALHALAVLEGRNAADFAVASVATIPAAPDVPAGLPSQLLERRPDVAQRERALAAATEQIGVAAAAFFPTIRLTAFGGVASNDLSTLFEADSRITTIGPSITFPLFDGGRNRAAFEAAQARYREALASYRSNVLVAFQETSDALSDAAFLRERGVYLRDAVVSATQAASISRARYDRGQANYFEVVDSERAALVNRRAEIQNDQLRLASAVALVKALGGGWERGDEVPALPREDAPGQLPHLPTSVAVP